jgi:hypothetical protein
VRPFYGPIAGSISVQLETTPDTVIDAVRRAVVAAGFRVAINDPREGFLETGWYDPVARRPVHAGARDLARTVKLRFFADPTAGHTRLAAECVQRFAYDPSEPARDLERMVPDSTPGRVIMDSVLARLKALYPLGSAGAPPAAAPVGSPPP